MASPYEQERRQGELHTPLGKNALVLRRFDGVEAVSELFEYRVEAISHKVEPNFDKAIGRNCTVVLSAARSEKRHFDGILTDVELIGVEDTDFIYRLTLRPWLWILSKRTNCLIFHKKTAPQIIEEIFAKNSGFAHCQQILSEDYPTREYTVQYRESDMAFVCRLMEEHGISYHFRHEEGKHTLIMGDSVSAYKPVPGASRRFVATNHPQWHIAEYFNVWRPERRFTAGKATLEEYDFKKPKTELRTDKSKGSGYANGEMEMFDYPGRYTEADDGRKLANWWIESEQAADQHYFASGECLTCPPGFLLTLIDHPNTEHNREYLILRVHHFFAAQFYRSTSAPETPTYRANHELMPSNRPYAPPQITPAPRVHGPQTATVVGDGEIDCDEYGRILVRFHWDRKPDKSMRVRVAQVWASQKWGGIFIPRVGMEVIVDHLEGDPDQPIVVGCVYNADNMPPYPLPDEKNQAGWKSQSTPNAPGYNELMMDDTAGKELVRFHAQKNLDSKIEADETRDVGMNIDTKIGMNSDMKVGMNRDTTVGLNDTLNVSLMRNVTAGVQMSLTVGASSIVMTPVSIAITSPSIMLNGSALVSISSGAAFSATAGAAITMTTGGMFSTSAGAISAHTAAASYAITAPIFKVTGMTILTGPPVISPA